MGKHSNKKKKVDLVVEPTPGEPPKVVPGNLGNVHKLIARHQLKDRVAIFENIIKTHQPLMQAMKITQNAYQQGVMEGIRQVAEAERLKEQAQTTPEQSPAETGLKVSPKVEDGEEIASVECSVLQ